MARELLINIKFGNCFSKIADIVEIFYEIGWDFQTQTGVEYLPFGDGDNFNWQKKKMSKNELRKEIEKKQNAGEIVGMNLFYKNTDLGISLLIPETSCASIGTSINRKTISTEKDSLTDIGWYFEHIVVKMAEKYCVIDSVEFHEYIG